MAVTTAALGGRRRSALAESVSVLPVSDSQLEKHSGRTLSVESVNDRNW